uniref:Uncharacterized protein n=1 Tax=viral metagenome TaxID=1070528 RepID=A0A6H1Z8N6_9ZZZZ
MRNEMIIKELSYMVRTYDGLNKLIVSTKNRLTSFFPVVLEEGQEDKSSKELREIQYKNDSTLNGYISGKRQADGLEQVKGRLERSIGKHLVYWDIWNQWLTNVPGIGHYYGGKLILLYYYKFESVCPKCGDLVVKKEHTFFCETCQKSIKGEGNLVFKITERDFPRISSWNHFLGMHNTAHHKACRKRLTDDNYCPVCKVNVPEEDIIYLKPMRQAGVQSDWSSAGRTLAYLIAESFVKASGNGGRSYRDYYDSRRELRDKTHPDFSKGHKYNMAKNETVKLFLSHFWQVARTIDGKPLTEPYIVAKDPVHNKIEPFYWEGLNQ